MKTRTLLKRLERKNPETLNYEDHDVREFVDRIRGGQIKFFNGPMTGWGLSHLLKRDSTPAPYIQVLLPYAWFKEFPYLGFLN